MLLAYQRHSSTVFIACSLLSKASQIFSDRHGGLYFVMSGLFVSESIPAKM